MIISEITVIPCRSARSMFKNQDQESADTAGSSKEFEMCADEDTVEDPEDSQATNDQECDELHQNTTLRPLTLKQVKALEWLAEGHSVKQVAEFLELHRSTIHGWLKTPKFIEQLEVSEQETRREIRLRSQRIVSAALTVLEDALDSESSGRTQFAALKLLGIGTLMKSYLDPTRKSDGASESKNA